MAAFNSFGSIVPVNENKNYLFICIEINENINLNYTFLPEPSVSNKLNASRISSISSSLKPGRSYDFAGFLVFPFGFLDDAFK